jgi:hypothetical protein
MEEIVRHYPEWIVIEKRVVARAETETVSSEVPKRQAEKRQIGYERAQEDRRQPKPGQPSLNPMRERQVCQTVEPRVHRLLFQ